MKSIFINNQVEYRLEVVGDAFSPGDSLPCLLTLNNRGQSSQKIGPLSLILAEGNLKKVKEKSADAFTHLSSVEVPQFPELAAGQSHSFNCTLQLAQNAPITDKATSVFILFGDKELPNGMGQLLVTVQVHPHIKTIISILETSFQFVYKGEKADKGWVKTKLKPPAAKRFSMVEELNLSCRFDQKALELEYAFRVKEFDVGEATVGVKKAKNVFKQRLESSDYLLDGGHINYPAVEKALDQALEGVSSGF